MLISPDARPDAPDFMIDGGTTGALLRAHPWADTPLGSPHAWPQPLKTLVGVLLTANQPMFVAWGEQRTLLYNDGYAEVLADKHPAALGRDFLDVWDELRDDLVPIVDQAYGGTPVHMDDIELLMLRKGYPEETHFAFSYTPVRDETGAVAGFFCPCVEITEQVLGERRRLADVERQRRLFEQAPGFIAVLDGPEHVFEFTNAAYRNLTGNRVRLGDTVRQALPELVGQGFYELLDQVFTTGSRIVARDTPIQLDRPDGRFDGFLDFIYEPIIDEAGRVTGIFVEGHDVSDGHRAQVDLRETEQRYRLAAKATNDAIWDWDLATNHIGWNEAVGILFDYAQENVEPTGDWWMSHIHPDDRARVERSIHAVIDGGGDHWAEEYRFLRGNGSFADVYDRGHVVRDAQGLAVRMIGAMLDLTERKRAEAALRELNETLETRVAERTAELIAAQDALRQSQKMEAVGQLTGGLAHDFNNLLTGISGSLEMMQIRIAQGRTLDVERYVGAAQGAAKRAAALTHRLLAFSRRQTLTPKPTDVRLLVTGMEELISRTVGPSIEIESVNAAGLWPSLIDPSQLENAILNLCLNARDAMPDGGKITIESGNRWMDQRAAEQRGLEPGQYISLCVSDTGTGMTADVIEKAFDPFFTTKPIGSGTGLGLSMIYGFAKQSGGSVSIYSEVEQGTTICIYLPRHLGPSETDEGEADGRDAPRADEGETVLVVDDEPTVRMLVAEVLTDLGYIAIEAADGIAGLKIINSEVRIDLLVTDVGLPGMNGRQVADAARSVRPDLKVLFITGYAENAVLSHGHLDPGMHVLTKPFAMEVLATRIRGLIEA